MSITTASVQEILKRNYGNKKVHEFLPEEDVLLMKILKYNRAKIQGEYLVESLRLQYPNNAVATAANTVPTWTQGVYANGIVKQALVRGSNQLLFDSIGYELVKQSETDQQAIESAVNVTATGLLYAANFRASCSMLHGQLGIGTVESVGSVSGSGPYTRTAVITEASWIPAVAEQLVGATIDIWSADYTTQQNGAALLGATSAGIVTVTNVDLSTRTLTLSSSGNGTSTGTDGVGTVGAGEHIFFQTYSPTTECAGLSKLLRAASGDTIYGLSATTYPQLRGNVLNKATVPFSTSLLLDAGGTLADRNGGGDYWGICSNRQFNRINSEESALVRHTTAAEEAANGFSTIVVRSGAVKIFLAPTKYQKAGQVSLVPKSACRIGSSDIGFVADGEEGNALHIGGAGAREIRLFSNMAPYVPQISQTLMLDVLPVV